MSGFADGNYFLFCFQAMIDGNSRRGNERRGYSQVRTGQLQGIENEEKHEKANVKEQSIKR